MAFAAEHDAAIRWRPRSCLPADQRRSRSSLRSSESRRHVAVSPSMGKSHLGAVLGHALTDNGYRVLLARTADLVQKQQSAPQELTLAAAIEELDKYHLP